MVQANIERVGVFTIGCHSEQARGLVHHDQRIVLKDRLDPRVFQSLHGGGGLQVAHSDPIPGREGMVELPNRRAVDGHRAKLEQVLNRSTPQFERSQQESQQWLSV
jgi:hypothetical protein